MDDKSKQGLKQNNDEMMIFSFYVQRTFRNKKKVRKIHFKKKYVLKITCFIQNPENL
jgi:hypothetical protein